MTAELARAGGLVAALGLAVLLVGARRDVRLAGLAVLALGAAPLAVYLAPQGRERALAAAAPLAVYLAPEGRERALAAAAPVGLLLAAALAFAFRRHPWLLPMAALACVPARIPVDIGSEEANLLLPLYGVIAAAGLALAWELVHGEGPERELGLLAWPLGAFVAWSGVSLLWTDDLRQGGISLLAFYLPFGLLAVCLARLEWSRRWLGALCAQLGIMAIAFAAIGIYQWLTGEVFWNRKVIVGNVYAPFHRVNSVFWDPSIYGRFLVVAILAGLVVVLYGAGARAALAAAAGIAVVWTGLLFSFSQSSFVALMAGVLATAAFAWRWRVAASLAAVAAAALAVSFAAPPIRNALADDVRSGLNKASSNRFDLVTNGLEIAADHPVFGVGLGGFKRAYAEATGLRGREPKTAASHNTPITVAAELGLPGFLLLAWLLGAAFVAQFRRASRSFAGRASLVFGLAFVAIVVHSLFYNALFEDPMTWGLLGLSAVAYAWRTSPARQAAPLLRGEPARSELPRRERVPHEAAP
ncbi:MAG: O-antigen ligase family protein [Actinobacteria bacterium]|nr:O-antigen ligase family protein [Actinomycetota bacterium]